MKASALLICAIGVVLLASNIAFVSAETDAQFLSELTKDTYNYFLMAEGISGKGLPVNWYNYLISGEYASPEEARFYMLSHIGAQKAGLIDANTAKNRIQKTLSALKGMERMSTTTVVWAIGTDEAPNDYTANAFDEFDQSNYCDGTFYVGTDPTSHFPKHTNDWSCMSTTIYFDLTSAQAAKNMLLYLDTLYATHDDKEYCGLKISVNGKSLGTHYFSSLGAYPEAKNIPIASSDLRVGRNSVKISIAHSKYSGYWVTWDSVKLLTDYKDKGLYYRFYSTQSLAPVAKEVPSIGNAMLAASLIVIKEWAKENGFTSLASDSESIINKINLRRFYNSNTHLFYHDLSNTYSWDYYSDEGRLLSFIANALGRINDSEFRDNLGALTQHDLYYDVSTGDSVASSTGEEDILVKKASWDGSMFTYIVPALFIQEKLTDYQTSTIDPAVKAQITYANKSNYRINGKVSWGISDANDVDGTYCWQNVGAAPTAAKYTAGEPYESCPSLITPHASALAFLSSSSTAAVKNLKNLKSYSNFYDANYGFRDSLRVNTGERYDGMVTLDQEWIFLALMNKNNGIIWNYLYKDPRIVKAHGVMYPSLPDTQNCNVQSGWGITYAGTHDVVGLDNGAGDKRFLCFDKRFYDCGWEMNDKLSIHATNGQTIGSWKCDLVNGNWSAVEACVPSAEVCSDGKDNDCDGLIDGDDSNCQATTAGNCNATTSWGANYAGVNNTLGLDNGAGDKRFLCWNGKFYECGWELYDLDFANKMAPGGIAGPVVDADSFWTCNLTAKKWIIMSYSAPPMI